MQDNFKQYCVEIDKALKQVQALLSEGLYYDATQVMSTLTKRQAQTSLSMRAALIKAGLVKEN